MYQFRKAPKVTRDDELATPEAIQFRIDQIVKEKGGVLDAASARRIASLRSRLPAKPGGAVREGASDALLASKADCDEYCNATRVYA